jgi:hypothetical protein
MLHRAGVDAGELDAGTSATCDEQVAAEVLCNGCVLVLVGHAVLVHRGLSASWLATV